jgi:predicted PurR-regulated permease PerM
MIKPNTRDSSSLLKTLGIFIAIVGILYFAREILVPLAFAVILALILTPAVQLLQKAHFGRGPAAIVVVTLALAIACGIGLILFNQLIEVINELPGYRENIDRKIQAIRSPAKGALGRATENVRELSKELAAAQSPAVPAPPADRTASRNKPAGPAQALPVQVVAEPTGELQYLRALTQPFLSRIGACFIVLIFTSFLLIEQADLRNRLLRLAGLDRLNLMTTALDDATRRVSRYLMLQLMVNACFGIIFGSGLYLIGVPYASLWAAVAAILRIVPYLGSAIAGVLPLVLSLAVFDGWLQPFLVFVLFATLELVTANFLEPWLYGAHTGISSLALLLTAVIWTALWGPAGLILSTPLTVCLVVLGRHVPQFSFLHILLGDEPALGHDAQLYQRLLAMDGPGARAVVDQCLAESKLAQLCDTVIIPTLTMAERDRHHGALDSDREEFIFMSLREMMGDLGELTPASSEGNGVPGDRIRSGRVFCIPAHDESDEISAAMLAQLLGAAGCPALCLSSDESMEDGVSLVDPTEDDVFCICAVPPFAFGRARTLAIRIRRKFPRGKVLVGIWGFSGDAERALKRFQPSQLEGMVTSLAAAIEWAVGPIVPEGETGTGNQSESDTEGVKLIAG